MDSEDIIGFGPLYESMCKCQKGVMWKDSVAHYVLNSIEETIRLENELKSGKYKARPTYKFTITSPKPREIISIAFRDRVYQRSLNDNALYPAMTRSFIRDNWACQRGKGTTDALDRMKVFLRRMYRKYGLNFYGLQVDIHDYYGSMQHKNADRNLRRKLDPETAHRAITVLDGQYAGETGYNPGSQMVQIVGISALDGCDHAVKERMGVDEYGRYMDDSLIFSSSIETLEQCRDALEKLLAEEGMSYNPKKTHVFSIKEGFLFLGFFFRVTKTGKVIMSVSSENVRRQRRKLKRLINKCRRGGIPKAKVYESYASWRAHAELGNSHNLVKRMDQYFKSLWEAAC